MFEPCLYRLSYRYYRYYQQRHLYLINYAVADLQTTDSSIDQPNLHVKYICDVTMINSQHTQLSTFHSDCYVFVKKKSANSIFAHYDFFTLPITRLILLPGLHVTDLKPVFHSSLISPFYAPYFQLLVRFLFPTRECDTVDYIFRKMGLKYRTYLEGRKVYGCQNCRSHLANSDGLISKVNVLGSLASIKNKY